MSSAANEPAKAIRTITLEEHYATPAFLEGPGSRLRKVAYTAQLIDRLSDLDGRRIADMDAAGIDAQVLSLTSPGVNLLDPAEAIEMARDTNDLLAEAVKRHPSRFIGFAVVPTSAPDAAADELERAVGTHGFKGVVINGHTRGRYLDNPCFRPILERAEALDVPIHIHPATPPKAVVDAYYTGAFSPEVTGMLANAGWGWHIETAVHVLRLILGGAFDRFPRLQLIVGHLGEALPFMMPRINEKLPVEMTKLQRPIKGYLVENCHFTFSGFNFLPAFLNLMLEVGVDRIMFSADYPYASMSKAREFLDQLPVSPTDREKIAHGNAERLLRI